MSKNPNDHTFSYRKDGVEYGYDVPRLWALARNLPTKKRSIAEFQDKIDLWIRNVLLNPKSTPDDAADHLDRVRTADLKYPIILMANGQYIMDGMHRLMHVYLSGGTTVLIAQFDIDPPPDRIINQPPSKKW